MNNRNNYILNYSYIYRYTRGDKAFLPKESTRLDDVRGKHHVKRKGI